MIVSVSGGDTAGGGLWTGSGVALSSGLIEALGEGLAVAVGVDFGFDLGVGDGDSSVVAGVFAWNGVDAASCARSGTAEANNTIPITNARMNVFNFWPTLACTRPLGQEQYNSNRHHSNWMMRPVRKSKWTQRGVATKSSFLMKNPGAPNRSWR